MRDSALVLQDTEFWGFTIEARSSLSCADMVVPRSASIWATSAGVSEVAGLRMFKVTVATGDVPSWLRLR
jgi:hypothetical protein